MLDATGVLLFPDGSYALGGADRLLNERDLGRAYGVPTMVVEAERDGRLQRFCRPVVE